MNNFTPRAQQVLALARKEAERFNHNYVGTEHVLLGVLRLGQGVAVNVLQKLGLDLETVRIEVEKQVGAGPNPVPTYEPSSASEPIRAPAPAPIPRIIPYTPRVKKVLALAGREAKQLNHTYVGTEHILLGLLRENDGAAARVLLSLNVDLERTREEILKELDPNSGTSYPDRQSLKSLTPDERTGLVEWLGKQDGPAPASGSDPHDSPLPPHPGMAPYLAHDEVLLWSGEPSKKFRFERRHFPLLFLIPFFLFFLMIALTGILSDGGAGKKGQPTGQEPSSSATTSPTSTSAQPAKPPPLPVRIFLAVFVVTMLGGFFSFMATIMGLNPAHAWRGAILYGVTNQRLIIISGRRKKTVRSIHLGSITGLRMQEWPDGLGKITFGPEQVWPYRVPFRDADAVIENIAEPHKVFKIIADVRKLG